MMAALAALSGVAVVFGVLWQLSLRRLAKSEANLVGAKARLRDLEMSFREFAPHEVVDAVAEARETAATGKRVVTVLFADLRGFTSLSERLEPEQLVALLNGYLQAMDQAIAEHHGRVAKFLGDGLLALFGAMQSNPWQARDAVLAALAMRTALSEYNHGSAEKLSMGIGIHSGEVVAGVMGSERLREFTVIGDTVNTAARVESLTRLHEVDILITQAVKEELRDQFRLRPMPPSEVKGKSEPLLTWAVEEPAAAE